MLARMLFFTVSIILILKSVSSEFVKCPDSEIITGLNINELNGDWHLVNTLKVNTDQMEVKECAHAHITIENESTFSFTFHVEALPTSEQPPKSLSLIFNVQSIGDGTNVVSYFDKNFIDSRADQDKEFKTFVRNAAPNKYLTLVNCAKINNESFIASEEIYSRLNANQVTITTEENDNLIKNSNIKNYVSIVNDNECFSTKHE